MHLRAQLTKSADPADVQWILDQLDLSAFGELAADVEPLLLQIAQDGIAVAFRQIAFDAPADILDQVNERALAYARDRAAELVGRRYDEGGALVDNPNAEWAITDGTRELLRGEVASAIEDGTSAADLAGQLEASYAFSADRAETIARTELARADVAGNMMAYEDSGMVIGKEWVLGSEHADDDECDDAAAMGIVELDDDFGGIGDAPAHPNCVCDVLPVLAADA